MKAKEKLDAEDKARVHEIKVWQSDGRKEINANEAAALKEYERVELEASKVKSEQARVVSPSSCVVVGVSVFFLLHVSLHLP